MSDEI